MSDLVTQRRLVGEAEAATYIGMSRSYLRKARSEGAIGRRTPGPPYHRIGKAIRYDIADLDNWVAQHRVLTGDQATHATQSDGLDGDCQ